MPNVHDEDEAVTVGVLPNLVLEGVVEDEDFTLLPFPATQHMKKNERLAETLCFYRICGNYSGFHCSTMNHG